MKVDIWKDERYPDYGVSTVGELPFEISDELYDRYKQVSDDYDEVQDELAAIRAGRKK